jgi:hypothetical protein
MYRSTSTNLVAVSYFLNVSFYIVSCECFQIYQHIPDGKQTLMKRMIMMMNKNMHTAAMKAAAVRVHAARSFV